MSRIAACFAEAKAAKRKLLIPYVMGGDPNIDDSLKIMHTLVSAGADIIELGMPFSDPMADGPVVQAASDRVLEAGIRLPAIFDLVKMFRQTNDKTPIVLMGYANPIEITGYEVFAQKAAEAGVDGVITVDLPPEEAGDLSQAFAKHDLDPIFLVSPTTPDNRVKAVCDHSGGFIYYVSLKGVTGSAKLNTTEVATKVAHIKELSSMPVGVGFGINDAESAAQVATVADAVIVGSVIVKKIVDNASDTTKMLSGLTELVGGMRSAIDNL